MVDAKELESLSKEELYELAQKADVAGRSDMTKKELVKALSNGSVGEDWSHSGERSDTGRAIWTGAITFGLITIPVGLYTATEDRDISFHLLTADGHARVRNQRVSSETGKEVEWEDLVRGFEYESGRYVVFTDEELDQIPSESQRVVDVVQFTDQEQIDPVFFERSYYVAPADTGVKAYKVLTGALEESGRVGVGKVTIRNKERPCTLRVDDGVMLLETMRWPDEIRVPAFENLDGAPEATDAEVKTAVQLVDALTSDFDPAKFSDSYRQRLEDAIAAKIAGEEISLAAAPEEQPAKVTDLLDALRASVEESRKKKTA